MTFPWAKVGGVLLLVLYYILLPIFWVLRLIWAIILIVSAPALHVTHYLLHALALPFRILAQFETLYIFFGVAILVGAVTGVVLHFAFSRISQAMGMNSEPAPEPAKTVAEYRADRAKRKAGQHAQDVELNGEPARNETLILENSGLAGLKYEDPKSLMGLMSTTILEEVDSSDADFGWKSSRAY